MACSEVTQFKADGKGDFAFTGILVFSRIDALERVRTWERARVCVCVCVRVALARGPVEWRGPTVRPICSEGLLQEEGLTWT